MHPAAVHHRRRFTLYTPSLTEPVSSSTIFLWRRYRGRQLVLSGQLRPFISLPGTAVIKRNEETGSNREAKTHSSVCFASLRCFPLPVSASAASSPCTSIPPSCLCTYICTLLHFSMFQEMHLENFIWLSVHAMSSFRRKTSWGSLQKHSRVKVQSSTQTSIFGASVHRPYSPADISPDGTFSETLTSTSITQDVTDVINELCKEFPGVKCLKVFVRSALASRLT